MAYKEHVINPLFTQVSQHLSQSQAGNIIVHFVENSTYKQNTIHPEHPGDGFSMQSAQEDATS